MIGGSSKLNLKEIKKNARPLIMRHYNLFFTIWFFCYGLAIYSGLEVRILMIAVTGYFVYGTNYILLLSLRDKKTKANDLFVGFNDGMKLFVVQLEVMISSLFWIIIFIIPGIIKGLSYTMVFFIMIDNPEMGIEELIKESKRIMGGHKKEFFLFQISFIGWFVLSLFTLGFALLFFYPYYMGAKAAFYEGINGNADAKKEEGLTSLYMGLSEIVDIS